LSIKALAGEKTIFLFIYAKRVEQIKNFFLDKPNGAFFYFFQKSQFGNDCLYTKQ